MAFCCKTIMPSSLRLIGFLLRQPDQASIEQGNEDRAETIKEWSKSSEEKEGGRGRGCTAASAHRGHHQFAREEEAQDFTSRKRGKISNKEKTCVKLEDIRRRGPSRDRERERERESIGGIRNRASEEEGR
ncbi:hypothetical protein PGIGA_G00071800 [Pangasianodon gigas]|uniref:Uncharacterized protein n=1 Tax=Pangasianodon gigas TaxID=30993 RepID=A0ACC5X7K5_PANGG|nr:hypothetical protein [Pangasianodon gigas]